MVDTGGDRHENLFGAIAFGLGGGIGDLVDDSVTSAGLTATTTNEAFSAASATVVTSTEYVSDRYFARGRVLLGHHQVLDLPARAQQPRQQRLADTSTADDRDSGHGESIADVRRPRYCAGGTMASWRLCTTMRPSQSTTMWSSSNQS